jgi:hypothetical protein
VRDEPGIGASISTTVGHRIVRGQIGDRFRRASALQIRRCRAEDQPFGAKKSMS